MLYGGKRNSLSAIHGKVSHVPNSHGLVTREIYLAVIREEPIHLTLGGVLGRKLLSRDFDHLVGAYLFV